MNRINKLGMKLLDYKEEYAKDYPSIVYESMSVALKQMVTDGLIDNDTFNYVTNGNMNKKMFLEYIENRKEYTKSADELRKEFEGQRLELDSLLELHDIDELTTEISVEKESLVAVKTFSLDETFIMDFLGVTEKEMTKLMKRGGFVEIFVSLRLSRVFNDIIEACQPGISHIKIEKTLPYLMKGGDGYCIDLLMEMNINDFSNMEWREKIWKEIEKVSELSEKIFTSKMTI